MNAGIDATNELLAELDRLSVHSRVARRAPRSKGIYRYLADGMRSHSPSGSPQQYEFQQLAQTLLTRLGIWWSVDAYQVMPIMTPWCVRDRACRYDQGPESWGAPRRDGFLRDDNSIIKKLPLPVTVAAASGHPYDGRRPLRGFTACHIWRDLPGGSVAGEDPWLYSFMPNLVWLPSWLAPLTDQKDSYTPDLLQRSSYHRFSAIAVEPEVRSHAAYCWSQLPEPGSGPELDSNLMAEFRPDVTFFRRRVAYLTRFVEGCDSVLTRGITGKKLICTRYTLGLPKLDAPAVLAFATEMRSYRDAVESTLDRWPHRNDGRFGTAQA